MNKNLKNLDNKNCFTMCFSSFLLVFIIVNIIYMLFSYAPFGGLSLATADAKIQYLDFFHI